MLSISLAIGPVESNLQTDERLTFDGIETILNRLVTATNTLFIVHLNAIAEHPHYLGAIQEDDDEAEDGLPDNVTKLNKDKD
jgi:hypothetical protein